jgi:hypothetical protein
VFVCFFKFCDKIRKDSRPEKRMVANGYKVRVQFVWFGSQVFLKAEEAGFDPTKINTLAENTAGYFGALYC